MVQADNPDRIKELISLSGECGADAFGMQLCRMKPQFRSSEIYKELFLAAAPKPVYVTNYRLFENAGKSEETLACKRFYY